MKDPRINLRNPPLAALLAFLIPGAGHFYQRRNFKAAIYCVGILSLFFAGMMLGSWQPVYSQVVYSESGESVQMQPSAGRIGTNYSIGYAAQFFVGLPALPALVQQSRFHSDDGVVRPLRDPLESDFQGVVRDGEHFIPVTGTLTLSPGQMGIAEGGFSGQMASGERIAFEVSGAVELGRQVFGSPRREISIKGLRGVEIDGYQPYEMRGSVRRSVWNWFQAPRDNAELDRLHGRLSQHFDIAYVFTWIAGLLNLMAIWDAYEGPAYGYGDEEPDDEGDAGDEPQNSKTPSEAES